MTELEHEIIKAVGRLQRNLQITERRGVFPWQVSAQLDVYRCEQSLRKDMMKLVNDGKLIRIGGAECRRGYKLRPERKIRTIPSLRQRFDMASAA